MEDWLGTSVGIFLGLTVVVFGGCGWLTGQGMAARWRTGREVAPYVLLLVLGDRFLVWGLFQGALWSLWGFIVHGAVIAAITYAAFGLGQARRMVMQYPWLYRREGLFGWAPLHPDAP